MKFTDDVCGTELTRKQVEDDLDEAVLFLAQQLTETLEFQRKLKFGKLVDGDNFLSFAGPLEHGFDRTGPNPVTVQGTGRTREEERRSKGVRSMIQVHRFDSEIEAYDASQTDDRIRDGDILQVGDMYAILIKAWPTWVAGPEPTEFHRLRPGISWADTEGGRYYPAALLVRKLTR